MSLAAHRALAVDAVLAASKVCVAVQERLVAGTTLQKGDRSPVTVADFAAQAIVSHLLGEAFGDLPLVGEEDATALRETGNEALKQKVLDAVETVLPGLTEDQVLGAIDRGTYEGGASGRHWTLDPIDGVLVEDGQVVLGVLGCPNLPHDASAPDGSKGCLFIGVKGEGATTRTLDDPTETPITVDGQAGVAAARFCESVESGHTSQGHSAQVAARLGITRPPFRIDSQCKYAAVARGDASIYLRLPTRKDYVERIWDHAAGWAVITEAGGRVSDVRGEPLDFSLGRGLANNKGVVVTNGRLHDEVITAVREVLGM